MKFLATFPFLALLVNAALAGEPDYLSPLARKLSRSDLDEIDRLISFKTSQPIVAICGSNNPHIPAYQNRFFVATATPGPHKRDFGCFEMERRGYGWRIVKGGTAPDPWLLQVVRAGP